MTRILVAFVNRVKIRAVGVEMPGPQLPHRVKRIVKGAAGAGISRKRIACVVVACVIMCSAFMAGTPARARQSDSAATAGTRPTFEVASVKPCLGGSGGRGGVGVGVSRVNWAPGRLSMNCEPMYFLISAAYVANSDGHDAPPSFGMDPEMDAVGRAIENTPLTGLPAWARAEGFTINAVADGGASEGIMMGPMLQSLLEERFGLKLHPETREVRVYDLVVAKGGAKLPQTDVICNYQDPKNPSGPLSGPAAAPRCNLLGNIPLSMAELGQLLRSLSWGEGLGIDGPVVDKTEISGKHEIHLWYDMRPDQDAGAPDAPPSIFTALREQLGLELVPAKGTGESLVIDHIEEPTAN